jgi:hypothetical protein
VALIGLAPLSVGYQAFDLNHSRDSGGRFRPARAKARPRSRNRAKKRVWRSRILSPSAAEAAIQRQPRANASR